VANVMTDGSFDDVMRKANSTVKTMRVAEMNIQKGISNPIDIVSTCVRDRSYTKICSIAEENHNSYAEAHGYGYHVLDRVVHMPTDAEWRETAWVKLPLILAIQLRHGKPSALMQPWVFWTDADSLFMNLAKPLPMPQDPKVDFVASGDDSCFINSGHLLMRRGRFVTELFRKAWDIYPPPGPTLWWEQGSLAFLLGGSRPACRSNVTYGACCTAPNKELNNGYAHFAKQHVMNSYFEDGACRRSGQLLCHFAGEGESKAKYMQQYSQSLTDDANYVRAMKSYRARSALRARAAA
jgi:hypothetical protein